MSQDLELRAFLQSFAQVQQLAQELAPAQGTPLTDVLGEHLGVPVGSQAVVSRSIPAYRFADFDVALEHLAGPDAEAIGIGGGDQRQHMSFSDMIGNNWARLPVGQVDWRNAPTGPNSTRRIIQLGIRLFDYAGQRVAVLQRGPSDMSNPQAGTLEALSNDPDLSNRLIDELQNLSVEHSVLRGNIVSLNLVGYEQEGEGYRFLPRPDVTAEDVILPDGTLNRIVAHISGIGEHRDVLTRYGQHLKRGILLYGPPGTGKTHTVRHLLSITPEHTVIVLSGRTLELVGQATSIAKKLEPSIVVLEDCDLIAMDRGMMGESNPLLFEVLDAVDGLEPASDVAFVLTTNRVDVLEQALTQRPGRIDLAAEIPRPNEAGRRRLLELYAEGVGFTPQVLDEIATDSDAQTASFLKELIRRAVLLAATAGTEPADAHLRAALDELLTDNATLMQSLLSGTGGRGSTDYGDPEGSPFSTEERSELG